MNKIKERMIRMMAGRYGTDAYNKAIIAFAFLLVIISLFIQIPIITAVLNAAVMGIIFFSMFRTYSRNISRRKMENDKFKQLTKPVRRSLSILKMRIKERKTSRFRTCPKCRVIIRTSKKRGVRELSCPRCKTEFKAHIYI